MDIALLILAGLALPFVTLLMRRRQPKLSKTLWSRVNNAVTDAVGNEEHVRRWTDKVGDGTTELFCYERDGVRLTVERAITKTGKVAAYALSYRRKSAEGEEHFTESGKSDDSLWQLDDLFKRPGTENGVAP